VYENLRDNFLYGLSDYYYTGKMPPRASLNMRRALDEHRKRLAKKGVTYSEIIKPSEEPREMSKKSVNGAFITLEIAAHYNIATEISDGKNIIKNDDSRDDVVHIHYVDRTMSAGDDSRIPLICPNCNHHADARTFSGGCPMCGTRFKINDLYPCVNACYSKAYLMPSQTSRPVLKKGLLALKIGGGIGLGIAILSFLLMILFGTEVLKALGTANGIFVGTSVIATGILWMIFYTVYSTKSTVGGIRMSAREFEMRSTVDTKKKMEGTICQLDPFFTYEVFEGKILSVVRTIAYSDNRKNCSFYCGNDELIFMDDLVDIRYRGGIEFIRADIVGDYLHVLATLYLDNIYYRDGRFIRKNENFQIELIRNRSVKTNPLITAYSINCPHCGASFDSVLSKTCPFCGSGFELAGHDWTIVRLYCVS